MDKNVYHAHAAILEEIKRKYRDRDKYPLGISSPNVNLNDKTEYWSAMHYSALYHLYKSVRKGDDKKAERLRKRASETLKNLEECEKRMGIRLQSHGLEHVTSVCGLKT